MQHLCSMTSGHMAHIRVCGSPIKVRDFHVTRNQRTTQCQGSDTAKLPADLGRPGPCSAKKTSRIVGAVPIICKQVINSSRSSGMCSVWFGMRLRNDC